MNEDADNSYALKLTACESDAHHKPQGVIHAHGEHHQPVITESYFGAGFFAQGWLNIAVEGLRDMRPSPTYTAKKVP